MEKTAAPEMLGYYDGHRWRTFTLEDIKDPEKLMIILKDIIQGRTHSTAYQICKSDSSPEEGDIGMGLFD